MSTPTNILHRTPTTIIVALSDISVGKVILPNPMVWVNAATGEPIDLINEGGTTVEKESRLLQYANSINDLMPKYIEQQDWLHEASNTTYKMLVMERLQLLPIHNFELTTRKKMFLDFETKLKALHDHNFVHGDFLRPTTPLNRGDFEWMFANIIQTATGLRLVDVGAAQIYNKDSQYFFHTLIRERRELTVFREYYLGQE